MKWANASSKNTDALKNKGAFMKEPYYMAYEKRYRAVLEAGADHWGHSEGDPVLRETLKNWVEENGLTGKKIVEFACGEGACGVILSELGCIYQGYDISPTAVEQAKKALSAYPNASVDALDMVKEKAAGTYDAALDCMGLHMLVTDGDRAAYLQNARQVLRDGAPMLFFREAYRNGLGGESAYKGSVSSFDEWKAISGSDYDTPQVRTATSETGTVEVLIPLVPARAKDREDYIEEMERAGFAVENFIEMADSDAIPYSVSVYVRKRKAKTVIHIFGASGSGTTTLGKKIRDELGYRHMDTDDYFWLPTNPKFTHKRPTDERLTLMKRDIEQSENVVISGAFAGWGDPLIPYFTLAVRIELDQNIRIERLRKREFARFGSRIEQGGDMYEHHLNFIEWAKKYDTGDMSHRSKMRHDAWEKTLSCEVVHLDGADSLNTNFEKILEKLK